MPDSQTIQVLVQGGAVSLALVAMYITFKVLTNHSHDLKDVVKKNNEVIKENSEVIGAVLEHLRKEQ